MNQHENQRYHEIAEEHASISPTPSHDNRYAYVQAPLENISVHTPKHHAKHPVVQATPVLDVTVRKPLAVPEVAAALSILGQKTRPSSHAVHVKSSVPMGVLNYLGKFVYWRLYLSSY